MTTSAWDLVIGDQTITATGAVDLTAQNNLALGRVEAGTSISITATTGAISDNTAAEGAGNEILVGGAISLTTTSGDIGNETDDIAVDQVVASGDVVINTGGAITDNTAAEGVGNENIIAHDVTLQATTGIGGQGNADVTIAAVNTDLQTASGNVFISATDTVAITNSALEWMLSSSDSQADAYAIPDYGVEDELDLMYMSSANEATWGENGGHDDGVESEEEE